MIHLLKNHIIPGAMSLLPPSFNSDGARAMLLTIAMQESRITYRKQISGPARGLWQFEHIGVHGVRVHSRTAELYRNLLGRLLYRKTMTDEDIHKIIEHNDILACGIARLLLLTIPRPFADPYNPTEAWDQYISAWRPGKPHPGTWNDFYTIAWNEVLGDKNKIRNV